MKRICKPIASFLLVMSLLMGLTTISLAADSSITYENGAENFVFFPGSEYTPTDLFDAFKDVMPGDVLYENIIVKNNSKECDYVKIYIRAEAHSEENNALSYSETYENVDGKDQANIEGERDETVATMQDFLSQLSMAIWNGDEVIYEASPDELDGLQNNVLLGEFKTGEQTELTVELRVPTTLGNEYANRVGEVDWVFVAEETTESTPDTGDTATPVLWSILFAFSMVVIFSYAERKRAK